LFKKIIIFFEKIYLKLILIFKFFYFNKITTDFCLLK
jgi:hypothetical protein